MTRDFNSLLRFVIIPVLLVSHFGCTSIALINRPSQEDLLTTEDSVTASGFLFNFNSDGEFEGIGAREELSCLSTFYRDGYEDYLDLGTVEYPYATMSDETGFFEMELGLSGAGVAQYGLYELYCSPLLFPSYSRLLTYRPDLASAAAPTQKIYVEWNPPSWSGDGGTDGFLVDLALTEFFNQTIDLVGAGINRSESLAMAELAKVEAERQFMAKYAGLRVEMWEPPSGEEWTAGEGAAANVQVVNMDVCYNYDAAGNTISSTDSSGCDVNIPNALGYCYEDWLNSDPSDDACEILIPAIGSNIIDLYQDSDHFSPDESISERIGDVGRFISRTMAHEIGHQLGLVNYEYLYGNVIRDDDGNLTGDSSHNPYEPAVVAAKRNLPRVIMRSVQAPWVWGLGIEDCFTRTPRLPGFPVERCPARFNSFNRQYLEKIQ
ncbi:MAG: hypothetical protein HYW02_00935 [Deltaproteobacteria bacterium]|nr:hypothetical protein [Deltaproteobacteria bacterium]MBI2500045.1 hypothetical protein [Deltaproteobacteria bacterium]